VGDWTWGLGELLGVGPSVVASMTQVAMKGIDKGSDDDLTRASYIEIDPTTASVTLPQVRIDGPYGAPAEDVFDCEVAVLIGAGIG